MPESEVSARKTLPNGNAYQTIGERQQAQMLKLITKGFYNELVNYGIKEKDIIMITAHLLDHIMGKKEVVPTENGRLGRDFRVDCIQNNWQQFKKLSIGDISITPLKNSMIRQIADWLDRPMIKYSFVSMFPRSLESLQLYFESNRRQYFGIFYQGRHVGLIGADNLDTDARKLEMRKFIGDPGLHGQGIGKSATFLFLYYCFVIKDFNKVYLHSRDTNINNLNLNSQFGFELEGIFFEDVVIDDEKRDVVRMGLVQARWKEIFLNGSQRS